MKTKNFTLYLAILMMGTVTMAAGQPARGDKNGNHENNNRKEIKKAAREDGRGNRDIRYNSRSNEWVRSEEDMHTSPNTTVRREKGNAEQSAARMENRKAGSDRRSYSESGRPAHHEGRIGEERKPAENHDLYRENRHERENRGYTDQRNYRDENRNGWDNRKLSRQEWEHRKYDWNNHNWNFSNHYRKGTIPYYFRDNHNYWYYPGYGHILKGFNHAPYLFYTGRIPIYFEDGFFYRYYTGIGYVWIENPYDLWFNELPHHAVRVRIHGRVYFRLGNAYFTLEPGGFRLAILPDRFYDPIRDGGAHIEISARF